MHPRAQRCEGGRPSKVGMSWKGKERGKLPMQGRGEQLGETWEPG